MKISAIVLAFSVVFLSAACNQKPDNPPVAVEEHLTSEQIQKLLNEAISELDKKNLGKSIDITVRITKSDAANVEAYLIQSQANSVSGDAKSALTSLELALKNGFKDLERLTTEHRFDSIRSSAGFQELLSRYGLTTPAAISEKEIKAGNTSIKVLADGSQVIKAGDISITIPKD